MFMLGSVAHGCRGVCFVGAFWLLFLLFLFGLFLDSGDLAQDFFPLFRRFPAAGKLHGKNLLDNIVKLWPSRHSQGFQLRGHAGKTKTNRPPLVQIGANLRERGGLVRLRHQIGHLIERQLFQKPVGIDGSFRFLAEKLLLRLQRYFLELQDGRRFRGPETHLR